jgi:hypothetical protein
MSLLSSCRIMLSVMAAKSSFLPMPSNSPIMLLMSSSLSSSVLCAASLPGSAPAACGASAAPMPPPSRDIMPSVCAMACAPAAPLCEASEEKTLAARWPSASGSAASLPPALLAPAPLAISCSVSSTVR